MKTVKYGDKEFFLSPFNTLQEKNILLYANEDESLDIILKILKDNIKTTEDIFKLSTNEKKALLYKLREISVGENINIRYKCSGCKKTTETAFSVVDVIEGDGVKNFDDIDLFEAYSEEPEDYFINKEIIEELDVNKYDEVIGYILKNKVNFNFSKKCSCVMCGYEDLIRIDKPKFLLDNMSESDISTIYRVTSELIFNSHYTKQDIDGMLPFEREVFIGLLNQHIESKLS